MDVVRGENGKYVILHAGREVDKDFDTEDEAWHWADANIDDQVFDDPNCFTKTPIRYRTPPPNPRPQ